jgi:hypothetical protein
MAGWQYIKDYSVKNILLKINLGRLSQMMENENSLENPEIQLLLISVFKRVKRRKVQAFM